MVKEAQETAAGGLATRADIAQIRSDMEKLELRLKHDLTLRLGAMIAAAVAVIAAVLKLH